MINFEGEKGKREQITILIFKEFLCFGKELQHLAKPSLRFSGCLFHRWTGRACGHPGLQKECFYKKLRGNSDGSGGLVYSL